MSRANGAILLLILFGVAACASLEENRVSGLIMNGMITAEPSDIEDADYEVLVPTLWGNGYDSDELKGRKWFVKEILTQKRLCQQTAHNFRIVHEDKVFSHAEDIARIAEREYYKYYVHVACEPEIKEG